MLSQAVKDGKPRLVRILLEGGRDANQETLAGENLLLLTLKRGHYVTTKDKILRLLLQYGADINKIDENGRTPLIYEVLSDDASIYIMSMLLEEGAKLSTRDYHGWTAMDYARKTRNLQVFNFLRDRMLDPKRSRNVKESQKDPKRSRNVKESEKTNGACTKSRSDKDELVFHDIFKDNSSEAVEDDDLLPTSRIRSRTNPELNVRFLRKNNNGQKYRLDNDLLNDMKTYSRANMSNGCNYQKIQRKNRNNEINQIVPDYLHTQYVSTSIQQYQNIRQENYPFFPVDAESYPRDDQASVRAKSLFNKYTGPNWPRKDDVMGMESRSRMNIPEGNDTCRSQGKGKTYFGRSRKYLFGFGSDLCFKTGSKESSEK